MKFIRTNSLKRLFSLKRRSFDDVVKTQHGVFEEEDKSQSFKVAQRPSWRCFSFEEIFVATNAFSSENLVGKGGYAEVYKGVSKDGEEIAVKRLTKASIDERKEKEFLTEIGTIGHVCHPNVLTLVGCCIDNGLYLIFHLSPRGSVASLLHDVNMPPMDWKTRYKIAVGTARGLHYLHKGCKRRIIHRDIKSSNILLTIDFEPQISDFGLAKWLPSQWTHHSIAPIEGTFGHLAPEYFMHGIVDEKTDVFAFGVFLLEIVSGRRPVDASYQSLHCWAKPILNRNEIDELVDPRLRGAFDISQLQRLSFAASLCIRASAWRPTMNENCWSWGEPMLDSIYFENQHDRSDRDLVFGPVRILEVLTKENTDKERWKMAEDEEEEHEQLWGIEDLEYECHTSFSLSPQDSTSTTSS